MDMSGERRIHAPRQKVWEALNDPEILKASIPGCDSMERLGENELKATASIKIGPISAKFAGKVTLADIDPPNGYTISGEGQGGVAGFAKGGASVRLTDIDGGTLLTYDVKAQVGGKIAQLGARLIDASAKQMAETFFDRFSARLAPAAPEPAAAPDVAVGTNTPVANVPRTVGILDLIPPAPYGIPIVGWLGIGVGTLILLILASSFLK
jgi:carbon monoxide dehydrogenase subunit G